MIDFFDSPHYALIGGLISLSMGIYFSIQPIGIIFKLRSTRNWKSVQATVTKSKIEDLLDSEGASLYRLDFRFEYTLGLQKHLSSGRYLDEEHSHYSKTNLHQFVDRFPVGKTITVFYDPNREDIAVFDRKLSGKYFLFLVYVIPFCGLGIYGIWHFFSHVYQ